jgi:adenylate cyclase
MPFHRRRLTTIALIIAATAAVVAALYWLYFDPLRKAEAYSRDLRVMIGRKAALDDRLVFLGIDKPSVQLDELFPEEIGSSRPLTLMAQGFPWSREVHALALERLIQAGAQLVIFDLLFPQPANGDHLFRASLDQHRDRVVIAYDFVFKEIGAALQAGIDLPVNTLITPTEPLDPRLGFDTVFADREGVLRRVPFTTTLRELDGQPPLPEDERYESIAARALRQLGRPELIPATGQKLFRFAGPPGTIRCRSIYEIFVPKLWTANFDSGAFFKGKIVMIGPEGSWSHDEHPTPFRLPTGGPALMAGPEIHLQALNAALQGDYLQEPSRGVELVVFVAAALVAFGVSLMPAPWLRLLVVFALVLGYAGLALLLYNTAGIYAPFVAPAIIAIAGVMLNEVADYRRERLEKARLRATLEQYVGEPVVRQLLADPSSYVNALGGVRKPVTVLFSDLRNFTGLTVGRDPAELVDQLNQYFSVMMEHVMEHNGTVDKLMGDSLMAVWGNLHSEGPKADALAALRAACAMTRSLRRLNEEWRKRDWPEFRFGIGLSHGEALVGNVGSARKMDFTSIGDVTNVASKIQELTSELESELVISDSLAALVKDEFELAAAGPVSLKGRPFAVNIFIVMGEKQPGAARATEPQPESVAP